MAYVAWVLELGVKHGELQNVRGLMDEMVTTTRSEEPGATHYEWSLDDKGSRLHLYERFADSDAVLKHLATFNAKFAERFMASLNPVRMTVYGNPNEEAAKTLEGMGATFVSQIGGFSR